MDDFKIKRIHYSVSNREMTPQEALSEIDGLIHVGCQESATFKLRALYDLAKKNGDTNLVELCKQRQNLIRNPYSLCQYDEDGAADKVNRRTLKPTVDIFQPELDPDKIYSAIIKIPARHVKGRFFWYVAHKVLCELDWLKVKTGTRFVEWLKLHMRWEWDADVPWENVPRQFKDKPTNAWHDSIIPGKKTGRYWKNLADSLYLAFEDKNKFHQE